ncbi:MAG: hypothetical protein ACTTKL_04205 [Treponema sp.]
MSKAEMILYVLKLVFGGTAAFLAVTLWSKTKDAAWMSVVAGAVTMYAGLVYGMLIDLYVILPCCIAFLGIPLTTLVFTVIPYLFFIIAFILMLKRTK